MRRLPSHLLQPPSVPPSILLADDMKSSIALFCLWVLLQSCEMLADGGASTAPINWNDYSDILNQYNRRERTFWNHADSKVSSGQTDCPDTFGGGGYPPAFKTQIEACHQEGGPWKRIGCTNGQSVAVLLLKCVGFAHCRNVPDTEKKTMTAECFN